MLTAPPLRLVMPKILVPILFGKARYKVLYGGRGGGKSWSIARAIIARMMQKYELVLCTREFQNSIADSVHRVISSQIWKQGLGPYFLIEKSSIKCRLTGAEIIFKGIRHHAEEIKSTEGITIVWLAEAQATSLNSWQVLDPTIREPGAEIWIDFNPDQEDDPIYKLFIVDGMPNSIVQKINWYDNKWFPVDLNRIRHHAMRTDPDAYDWIWEGHIRKITDAAIFRNRYEIAQFETPEDAEFRFGADFGFANDPSTLVRSFIKDDTLFIDYEMYGVGVEIDDLPAFYRGGKSTKTGEEYEGIPGADAWHIKADSARPETISYLARRGFLISAAEKWKGCVEDGIAHIKAFNKIVIHERCKYMTQEARLYSYKVDKKQLDKDGKHVILPVIEGKHDHCWDALRYSMDGWIQHAGGLGVWAKLGRP